MRLPIVSPCLEDWGSMIPAGANRRFCARCSQHVHFLSAMTEAEAERLLAAGERVCVRYQATADGTIQFRPALVSAPSRAFAMLAGLGVMLLTGCSEPRVIAIDDEVCVYDGSRGPQRVARGDGDCPPRVEVPNVEPLLWVELEPKPTVPDLAPVPDRELAQKPTPSHPPKPRAGVLATKKGWTRETMGLPVGDEGSPLDGL